MPLNISLIPGHTFPSGQAITLAALRKGALPSIAISGSVGTGDISDGAITTAKVTPGAYFFAEGSFASNAYSLSLNPAPTGLGTGLLVYMKVPSGGSNTVENPTLNVNGFGAKLILRPGGGAVEAGVLRAGYTYMFHYDASLDSANGAWVITSQGVTLSEYQYATAGSSNNFTITMTPTLLSYAAIAGVPFLLLPDRDNTGASTLNIDGLGAKAIVRRNGNALAGAELRANIPISCVYDTISDEFQIFDVQDTICAGESRNLRISLPSVSTVDVDADQVLLNGLSGGVYIKSLTHRADSVNLTLDLTLSGANGLDAGSEAGNGPDTKYFVWVIYNPTTDTVAGLLSTSSTTPVLPSGYDLAGLVGAVYNNGSSDLDRVWEYADNWRFTTPTDQLNGGPSGSLMIDVAHGVGRTPKSFTVYARCNTANLGFVAGDVIEASVGTNANQPFVQAGANATNVWLTELNASTVAFLTKTTGAPANITVTSWDFYVVAEW